MHDLGNRYKVDCLSAWSLKVFRETLINGHEYGIGILNDIIRLPIDFECSKASKMRDLQNPIVDWLISRFRLKIVTPTFNNCQTPSSSKAFREIFSSFDAGIAPKLIERLKEERLGCGLSIFKQCYICRTMAANEDTCTFCNGRIGLTARSDRYASRYQAKYSKTPEVRSAFQICYCHTNHSSSNTVVCQSSTVSLAPH